jgi:hypothetical protein
MIWFAKPVLREDLYLVQEEEFSVTCYMCDMYTRKKAKHIHKRQTHRPTLSSERMLHKDYDHKGSVEKKSLVMSLNGLGSKSRVRK